MKRTLSLTRETLAEITRDELAEVAAAAVQLSGTSCPLGACVAHPPTGPDRCYSLPWC